jgi:hypothetical protein
MKKIVGNVFATVSRVGQRVGTPAGQPAGRRRYCERRRFAAYSNARWRAG